MVEKKSGIERAIIWAETQQALAAKLGVGQSRISDWLARGYVPKNRVALVASVTGIPVDDLAKQTPHRQRA